MSRRSDDLPISKVFNNLIQDYRLEEKYLSTKIPTIWKEAVGDFISERTLKMYVKDSILYVHFSSSPLKQEVHHNKSKIITLVNEKLGVNFIHDIQIR